MIKYKTQKRPIKNMVTAWRKCPFCGTANPPSRMKCRNCGLKYPFELEWHPDNLLREKSIRLNDPRPSNLKYIDYIPVVAGILAVIYPMLGKYVDIDQFLDKFELNMIIVPGVVIIGAVVYLIRYKENVQQYCRHCGKVLIIRIPAIKSNFPQRVECWNCGTVHAIEWVDDFKENVTIS